MRRVLASCGAQYSTAASNIQRSLTAEAVGQLHSQGFAVIDGAHGLEACQAYRQEISSMWRSSLLHKNNTHLVNGSATTLLEKASIYEAELTLDPQVAEHCPSLAALAADSSFSTLLSLFLELTASNPGRHASCRLDSQAVKIQYNAGA